MVSAFVPERRTITKAGVHDEVENQASQKLQVAEASRQLTDRQGPPREDPGQAELPNEQAPRRQGPVSAGCQDIQRLPLIDLLSACPALKRLPLDKLSKRPRFVQELMVLPHLDDPALLHHVDPVGVDDC